jgi:hypothetical protein
VVRILMTFKDTGKTMHIRNYSMGGKMIKTLRVLSLVLVVGLLSSMFADKVEKTDIEEWSGKPLFSDHLGDRAIWMNHLIWEGNATLREIAIGDKIKGVTDDTIRLFTVQSSSPRQALLFTDTSTSATTPMENRWRLDTLYQATAGYYSAEIGDVDRDGDNDLIFGRGASPYRLMWKYWTGTGWNTDDTVITYIPTTAYMYDMAIGDADNDGNADDIIFTARYVVMRAWWNGSSWDTLTLWEGNATTCYGVAIGDFDAAHTGNEIVAVTYGPTGSAQIQEIMWNSGTSSWDLDTILMAPADWNLYDVEVGEFDSDNAGDEIVVGNGGTITTTEGSIIEIYGSGGSWSYRVLYTPPSSQYIRELAIGDVLDEHTGNEIVAVTSSSPYEVRAIYGSGTTWDNQAIFSPGGTSYGVAVGDVDQYRVTNDEIAVTGSYDVYEAEQFWPTNDLAITTGAPLTYPFVISDPESIWARVMNFGTAAQNNFKVYFYLDGTAYDSVDITTLAAGDSVDVSFGFVPGTLGGINFTVFHSLTPDEIVGNDTLGTIDPIAGFPHRFHDWVFETGTYKAEGFEYLSSFPPPGWVVINNDGGNYQWNWYTSSTNPELMNSGIIFASCRYESSSLLNDDWLITDMITPVPDYADSFGFYYRTYSASSPETLEVWVMDGQTVNDTVELIWGINIANQTYTQVKLSLDGYDGQGIYLAFRYVSDYQWYIDVDDVYWTSNYAPDTVGPDITLIEMPGNTYDPGPYTVRALITDPSGVLTDSLFYIVDDVATAIAYTAVAGDTFTYDIPTQPAGTCVDYYVWAMDNGAYSAQSSQERFWVLSPMAPTDLSVMGQADSTVRLDWTPPGEELSYYGTISYFWSGWLTGEMIATQFSPQHGPCRLEAVSMMFYQVLDTFELHVWADDGAGNPGADLYVDTIVISQLYPDLEVIDLSAEDIVVSAGDFHVGVVWLGDDTPYIMSDDGALTSRSKYNTGSGWNPIGYDWVMSALVSYVGPTPLAAVARTEESRFVRIDPKKASDGRPTLPRRIVRHALIRAFISEESLLEQILGISNFEVERSETQGGPYTSVGTTGGSSLVDNTVVNETRYYYVVKANYTDPDTVSYYSNEVNIGVDFNPPSYANTTYDSLVAGPWVVSTEITDWIGLAYDSLAYRADGGAWTLVGNDSTAGDTYYYTIAYFPSYTLIEFYLFSQDTSWWQNAGLDPAAGYYSFTVTAVSENGQLIPDHVFMNQNRPNPFARFTRIEYGVPSGMHVNIAVYNTVGQLVKTLVDGTKAPGYYSISWRGTDNIGRKLAEGVYFMRMTTDELIDTKKVIYIK